MSIPLLITNYSFETCSVPEALTSTTVIEKYFVKTNSGGKERYIQKTHFELPYQDIIKSNYSNDTYVLIFFPMDLDLLIKAMIS